MDRATTTASESEGADVSSAGDGTSATGEAVWEEKRPNKTANVPAAIKRINKRPFDSPPAFDTVFAIKPCT